MMVMEATTAALQYAGSTSVTKQEHQQQQHDVASYQQSINCYSPNQALQNYALQHPHQFLSPMTSASAPALSASSSSTSPLALSPAWSCVRGGGSYQSVVRSPSSSGTTSSTELHQLVQQQGGGGGGGERPAAGAGVSSGYPPYSSFAFYQTDPAQFANVDAHSMFYGHQQPPAVEYGQYGAMHPLMPYDGSHTSSAYSRSNTFMSQSQHLMLQRHQYLQQQQQQQQQQQKMHTGSTPPASIKSEGGSSNSSISQLTSGQQQTDGSRLPMTSSSGVSGKIHKPPFAWMAKQPAAASTSAGSTGKTRTSDKYRVVYTDLQKVELEKEFLYSKYITIQRKAELARFVNLSERQVKIWFQNRRAKERKSKKHDDTLPASPIGHSHDDGDSPSPDHVTEYGQPMKRCAQDDVILGSTHRMRPEVNHHLFSSYIHGH